MGGIRGDFIQSPNFTDILTGWEEMVAVKNKTQVGVFEGIEGRLPFSILGIDSDKGAKTPYRRVLASPDIEDEVKVKLRKEYGMLNPAELKRKITKLQNKFLKLNTLKQEVREDQNKKEEPSSSFEYIST